MPPCASRFVIFEVSPRQRTIETVYARSSLAPGTVRRDNVPAVSRSDSNRNSRIHRTDRDRTLFRFCHNNHSNIFKHDYNINILTINILTFKSMPNKDTTGYKKNCKPDSLQFRFVPQNTLATALMSTITPSLTPT